MKIYPAFLTDLEERQVVVIGGGKVAARKVEGLLAAGANVMVICPVVSEEMKPFIARGLLRHLNRQYRQGDLKGAYLVIAATDNHDVNNSIYLEALAEGCLINVVDDPQHCNFIVPAVIRRGDIRIAISTGGTSPALAHIIRERIESVVDPEFGSLAELLELMRPDIVEFIKSPDRRVEFVNLLIMSNILSVLRNESQEAARSFASRLLEKYQSEDHA